MFVCLCRTISRSWVTFDANIHKIVSAGYKSKISLENLYPKSDQQIPDPKKSETAGLETEQVRFSGVIPLEQLQIQYCRSSGAGGQNVNKVNSKVEMRFKVDDSTWIPDWIKPKLKEQQQNRVNKEGELVVKSEKTRKQMLNKADCLDKIRHMIFQASILPKELTPEQLALIKQRQEAADERRLADKRRRSLLKQNRQSAI